MSLAATVAAAILATSGCSGQPAAIPTIGSPAPIPTASATALDRGAELARTWNLTGAALPDDWPDIPLPEATEVTTAYAIGSEPRRTWTATFSADRGTALDLAAPVVKELRARGYVPIAEYVGAAQTNTGLYSFAAPMFAVYVVLGEDDGHPNLVITVRGSAREDDSIATGSARPSASGSAMPDTTPATRSTSSTPDAATPSTRSE